MPATATKLLANHGATKRAAAAASAALKAANISVVSLEQEEEAVERGSAEAVLSDAEVGAARRLGGTIGAVKVFKALRSGDDALEQLRAVAKARVVLSRFANALAGILRDGESGR